MLPVGPLPPNPAEFVGSHALAALLAELETAADLVLVDAPPILNLSDTMTLSARVDGLVVVARLPFLKRSTLHELHRVLSAAPRRNSDSFSPARRQATPTADTDTDTSMETETETETSINKNSNSRARRGRVRRTSLESSAKFRTLPSMDFYIGAARTK